MGKYLVGEGQLRGLASRTGVGSGSKGSQFHTHLALNAVTKTKESLKCRIQDKSIILHVKLTKWDVFFSFQAQSRQTEIW